jgi:hypothetical protein
MEKKDTVEHLQKVTKRGHRLTKFFEYYPAQPAERADGTKLMATNDFLEAEHRKWAKLWGKRPDGGREDLRSTRTGAEIPGRGHHESDLPLQTCDGQSLELAPEALRKN